MSNKSSVTVNVKGLYKNKGFQKMFDKAWNKIMSGCEKEGYFETTTTHRKLLEWTLENTAIDKHDAARRIFEDRFRDNLSKDFSMDSPVDVVFDADMPDGITVEGSFCDFSFADAISLVNGKKPVSVDSYNSETQSPYHDIWKNGRSNLAQNFDTFVEPLYDDNEKSEQNDTSSFETGDGSMSDIDTNKNVEETEAGKPKVHYLNGISDKWCRPMNKNPRMSAVTIFSQDLPSGRCTVYVPTRNVNKQPGGKNNVAIFGTKISLSYFDDGVRQKTEMPVEDVVEAWNNNATNYVSSRKMPSVGDDSFDDAQARDIERE